MFVCMCVWVPVCVFVFLCVLACTSEIPNVYMCVFLCVRHYVLLCV